MQRIVNLTPHALNLYAPGYVGGYDDYGQFNEDLQVAPKLLAVIPSSGVARVSSTPGEVVNTHIQFESEGVTHRLYDFPIARPFEWEQIDGLPDPQDGIIYVVSTIVAQRAMRADVLSPGTGPSDGCIRDEQGQIAGVTRLIAWV